MSDPRFPIGHPERPAVITPEIRRRWIEQIASAPAELRQAVAGLTDEQLDTPYREGGWTVRQLVHHVPDSHMNAYVRFRLTLTEENPRIKPYDEARWAELPDATSLPIEISLALLEALHARWVPLLKSIEEWDRPLDHPEAGPLTLDSLLCLYAWHGRHHVAHITALRERMGW